MTDIPARAAAILVDRFPYARIRVGEVRRVSGQPDVSVCYIDLTLEANFSWQDGDDIDKILPQRVENCAMDFEDMMAAHATKGTAQ